MRLHLGTRVPPGPRQDRFGGWKKAALLGLLLPWLTACNYTFGAGSPDGGTDSGTDSGADPDGQVPMDTGPDAATGICGNGTLNSGEQCDDGNLTNGDGCSSGCQVECCSGSTQDCNYPTWGTQNIDAIFVDPEPPVGFCQCAGFENTPLWDVAYDWEGNCLGADTVLRVRYWDTTTSPWTLLGDSTLSPMSLAGFAAQTFDASDHGGTEGILEIQGMTLFKDDPNSENWTRETCEENGPSGYLYDYNDMVFANRTNDKVVWVCSASTRADCLPEHELRMGDTSFGQCVAPPHDYNLAIALYRQNP